MSNYEALVILRPNLEEDAVQAVLDRFSNAISQQGGELVKVDKWGKRKLQYEIEKLREGYYVLLNFKGQPAVPQELERIMKIADDVIRFLVVRKE
ncbi:MAG: 30S ribosomal protein S6 [Heliobacteriaceae bacterium]|nr:30S ribosomal protein S6 [Heliobacteriaceae bacterium]MDD4588186.1 30S ribosomal protein S6 [Heliobacteriaceae bacterium]